MPASAGRIVINLSAGTSQFVLDMEKANAKMKEFGAHGVSAVQATSAGLRTLDGNFQHNLRAAERFLATTLHLGEAMKAAFPVFGAIALGGTLSLLFEKIMSVHDAFVKLREAPTRIAEEFGKITQPIAIANDELALTNDRLRNDIAKLEGKPQNALAVALDEARLIADKLAQSLEKDLQEVQKLLQEEGVGALKAFFTGNAPTSGLVDQWKKFQEKVTDINLEMNEKIAKESDPKKQIDLFNERTDKLRDAAQDEARILEGQLAHAQDLQRQREAAEKPGGQGAVVGVIAGVPIQSRGAAIPADQTNAIVTLKQEIANLQTVLANMSFSTANAKLLGLKTALEAAKEAAKPADAIAHAIEELQAKLAGAKQEAKAAPTENLVTDALAKGSAAASERIASLSENLKKLSPPARLKAISDITALENQIALTEMGAKAMHDRDEKLKRSQDELNDKLGTQQQLHDQLLEQINAESDAAEVLAKAEREGAEAVYQAQEKIKLAAIKDPEIRAATQLRDEIEHTAQIQKTVAALERETDATERLTGVAIQGIEARRAAEIENIRQSGQAPDVIRAQIAARRAQYALDDALNLRNLPASAGISAFFAEMLDNARYAARQMHDLFANAFEGINDNLAKLLTGQKASWSSFLHSMSEQIEKDMLRQLEATGAKKLGGVLSQKGGVLGKIGDVLLGKVAAKRDGSTPQTSVYVTPVGGPLTGTGGPPNVGPLGIPIQQPPVPAPVPPGNVPLPLPGGPMPQAPPYTTVPTSAQLGQPDGSSPALALWVREVGGSKNSAAGGMLQTLGMIIAAGAGSAGGGKAAGGPVHAGEMHLVGERGPELFVPRTSGTIIPNNKIVPIRGRRAMGGSVSPGEAYVVGEQGPEAFAPSVRSAMRSDRRASGNVFYSIDARGTDPVATEQRVRLAIGAAHNSAVKTSFLGFTEHRNRTP